MNTPIIKIPNKYDYGYFNKKILGEFVKSMILNNVFRVYHKPF